MSLVGCRPDVVFGGGLITPQHGEPGNAATQSLRKLGELLVIRSSVSFGVILVSSESADQCAIARRWDRSPLNREYPTVDLRVARP